MRTCGHSVPTAPASPSSRARCNCSIATERRLARDLQAKGDFVEVFIDTPLAVAEARDVKGLYKKARAGELPHFTGIDSPYEVPETPEIRIDTTLTSPTEAAEQITAWLEGELDYSI